MPKDAPAWGSNHPELLHAIVMVLRFIWYMGGHGGGWYGANAPHDDIAASSTSAQGRTRCIAPQR